MKRFLAAMFASAAILVWGTHGNAETCSLEIKKLDNAQRYVRSSGSLDMIFRSVSSQGFFQQIGRPAGRPSGNAKENFSKLVKKEPGKYVSEYPFKGVATLGTQQYAFVLDSAPEEDKSAQEKADAEKPDKKSANRDRASDGDKETPVADAAKSSKTKLQRYNRLYFDLNHNGDLTDDGVIQAETIPGGRIRSESNFADYTFPRTDLAIDVDGTKVDYAFYFRVYSDVQPDYQYASASLSAAAYREGEILVDGHKRRVYLVDFTCNGRFNDASEVQQSDKYVYLNSGDMIYIDPDPKVSGHRYGYDPSGNDCQQFVSKLINIDGKFYDMELTPSGDQLTLTPSSVPIGHVTNANQGYRAVVYGDQGFLKVSGDESGKAPLPEGDWKLLSYTIDRSELQEEETKSNESGSALWKALAGAITGSRPAIQSRLKYTMVAARAKQDYTPVKVQAGETVEFPFGPPYRPLVEVSYRQAQNQVGLGMSLVGSAGEVCSSLIVDGSQPPKPKFTIFDPDDTEVETGSFEYG